MRRNRVLPFLTLAVAFTAQSLLAQAVGDWRFAHPKATVVGGMRVSALMQSPLLKTALDQAGAKDPQVGMGLAIAQTMLRGIQEVRFSVLDNGSPSPDFLVMVTGNMDPTTLAMLKGQDNKMEIHSVDANTVLIGSGASLKAAVARLSQNPSDLKSVAFLQASQISPDQDLWIAGQIPNIPGLNVAQGLNMDLQGFAFGLSVTNNVGLEIAAQTATAAQAESLVKMVRDLEATQPAGTNNVKPEISVQGTTARLRVSVPVDEVMKAMQNPALAGLMGAASPTQQAQVAPLPPPKPVKPSRGTIIIQGLDSGTIEIPIEQPQARPGTVRVQ